MKYEKEISSYNLLKCEEMFNKLNCDLFNNRIRAQIKYNNRRRKLNAVYVDNTIVYSNELRYVIELPEKLVYKNDDSVAIWMLSQMIIIYGIMNEIKITSNRNIYKNKNFRELADKFGLITSPGKYGFEPTGITESVKQIIKDIEFKKVPIYSESNNGNKKTSTRKYTNNNNVSIRVTKDHILYCLDDCSPEIIDAAKIFFKQYGIKPLSVAI